MNHKPAIYATADIAIGGIPYMVEMHGTVSRIYPATFHHPAEGGEVDIASAVLTPDIGDESAEGLPPLRATAEELAGMLTGDQWQALEDALYHAGAEEQAGYGRRQYEREYD